MEKNFYDMNALARFIFIENDNNNPIDLVIDEGCSNIKELFFICVELLTNGLKILYGDSEGKVTLKDITLEQLKIIKTKLLLAKIDFEIDMIENKDFIIEIDESKQNIEESKEEVLTDEEKYNAMILKQLITSIDDLDDNLPLNEYCFKLELDDSIYLVKFNLLKSN
jgi:hypothetical protein